MKLVTWNVNSINARLDRLTAYLERAAPDVVCLQETKTTDEGFPFDALRALGYTAATLGQRTYNGVALLSRTPLTDVQTGFADGEDEDPQARLIWATTGGVRVCSAYFPNGQTVGADKWVYKLAWMARLRATLAGPEDRGLDPDRPFVLAGDFNVAPDDALDVAIPARWRGSVLTHDDARTALSAIQATGLVDTLRALHPGEAGIYSWWDYRALSFPKNDGARIDHVFATPALAARCTAAYVERNERKGPTPSDHAPVVAEFSL